GSAKSIEPGDYLLIGNELVRVERLPEHPDADTRLLGYRGRRFSYEGTTPVNQAVDSPVYKVALYDPHAQLPAGGMRPRLFTYFNDDGGPSFGKDSYLLFSAPADGDYYLRLKDARDLGGERFTYRLTIAPPLPDYSLSVTPASPNVPLGGRVPIQVFANRVDGFDGPIEVRVGGLPEGLSPTTGTILPGSYGTVLSLACSADLRSGAGATGFNWKVIGRAKVRGKEVIKVADPEDPVSVVSVSSPPDLTVAVEPQELTLEPGGEAKVT